MKSNRGITMLSLIITVVVMIIIAGTTVYTASNRNKVNDFKKMQTDIELLNDKVSNYYIKYGGIPILQKDNTGVLYTYTKLDFDKNVNDDENYYIIDLAAIGNVTLNYGKEGFDSPNTSDDVYIINNATYTIYYVKGIEYSDGKVYHSLKVKNSENLDTIPPTMPQINVVSGDKIYDTDENNFKTNVTLEFVQGKSKTSEITKTTYSINGSQEKDIAELKKEQYTINTKGRYNVKVKSYKSNGIYSEQTKEITVGIIEEAEYLESSGTQYLDMGIPYKVGMGFYMKAQQQKQTENKYYYPFGVYDPNNGNNYNSSGTKIGTRFTGMGAYSNRACVDYGSRIGLMSDGTTSSTQAGLMIEDNLYEGYCNYLGDNKIRIVMNDVETTFDFDLSTRTNNADTSINMSMFGIHAIKSDGTDVENLYTENCKAKIYEVRITLNKQTYADYKACYDSEKNEGYMYDTVNATYHYNKGTDTFKTNLSK